MKPLNSFLFGGSFEIICDFQLVGLTSKSSETSLKKRQGSTKFENISLETDNSY